MSNNLTDRSREELNKSIKIKVPGDLKEAVQKLKAMATKEDLKAIKNENSSPGGSHFGMGMWIRNNWGLWSGSKLQEWFHNIGIRHADDMSGIILDKFEAEIKGEDFDLDKEVKYYRDYWKDKGQDPDEIGKK